MMAFHIPLQESLFAWELRNTSAVTEWTGEMRENGVGASAINSGMFSAVVSRGDVELIVNGHEHKNDFMVNYQGVMLCYAATPSKQGYYAEDMLGGRVINFKQDEVKDITTYMTYDGPKNTEYSEIAKIDFEGDTAIEVLDTGNILYPDVDEWEVVTVAGKGANGSTALSIKLLEATKNNPAGGWSRGLLQFDLPAPSIIGERKYLRVWLDMTDNTVNLDFRKAAFGFYDEYGKLYFADNLEAASTFYALAEGATEWTSMTTGADGCFGNGQTSSMVGFKGWLAFPLESIVTKTEKAAASADTAISSFYFYHNIETREMVNAPFYIDDIELVVDYKF
jgi:hypothetical protein